MDMRAVCPTWRSAIAKPSPDAAFVDHRFRPRHWVMVDLKSENRDVDAGLFLHIPTGRFRRLRLPVLRDHWVLGASDGLLILMDREHPHLVHVFNPLTGHMLHFGAPLLEQLGSSDDELFTAVSGGPHPTLVVWREWKGTEHTVVYADPTSAEFTEEEIGMSRVHSMVVFQGNVYYADWEEGVFEFVASAEHCDPKFVVIAKVSPDVDISFEGDDSTRSYGNSYLVESAGELLLVRHRDQALEVFRVDVEHKTLEEVKSLGCRALFLGCERSMSVDANILPSVDPDCVYLYNWVETSELEERLTHVYNLRDRTMEILSAEPMYSANICLKDYSRGDSRGTGIFTCANNHCMPPLSLIQVLLDYCDDGRVSFDVLSPGFIFLPSGARLAWDPVILL
jgi:hypothetical protein